MRTRGLIGRIALTVVGCTLQGYSVTEVLLSEPGRCAQPVVLAPGADDTTRRAASDMARILGRMSGAEFAVVEGDGQRGLAVGTVGDFPALRLDPAFDPSDPMRREDYVLRSHSDGVYLIGATSQGARNAVWDFLYRLGYRQFFPGETWEVVPTLPRITFASDDIQRPSFVSRTLWPQHGTYRPAEPIREWQERNRMLAGYRLNTSHSYVGIVARNRAVLDQHPEYMALVQGRRLPPGGTTVKFCLSNPDLRALIVADRVKVLEEHPDWDSVTIDPSDGGNWCECDACADLGGPSDLQVLMANEVAAAVTARFPGKRVGMYAYFMHALPPRIKVHPAVIASIATGIIQGGLVLNR